VWALIADQMAEASSPWNGSGKGREFERRIRMRVTLLLSAFCAFAIAMLGLAYGFRGEVKALVARVEARTMGYEALP
jgi:hypothetical protein